MEEIIHLTLKQPKDGKSEFYFGSFRSMCKYFTKKETGFSISVAYKLKLPSLPRFENDKCIIERVPVIRSKQNRYGTK